jgi:hypothetical protein
MDARHGGDPMTRRPEFRVVPPRLKPKPAAKRGRRKPPSFAVVHKSLGEGRLVGLRLGESGIWLADVKFNGTRRTLQVQAEHWETPIADVLNLRSHFPAAKPQTGWPANDDSESGDTEHRVLDSGDDAETELELGEERIEDSEDEVEAEEIGADA